MSDDTFRWVITAAVGIAVLCIMVQAAVVLAMYLAFRKTQTKVHGVIDRSEPIIDSVRRTFDDMKPKIAAISTDATDVVKMARDQAERVSGLLTDFTDRAKVQVARLDRGVDDTMGQVQSAGDAVKSAVLKPVREVEGVLAGLRTALSVYTRGRKSSVNHATQDEEMFI